MKFRKKPIVIEAQQWFPTKTIDGVTFPSDRCTGPMSNCGWIETLEGGHVVSPGDWIITGIKGEKYPCKPDIFEKTYDPIPYKDQCK
jgi:hypothetical protein